MSTTTRRGFVAGALASAAAPALGRAQLPESAGAPIAEPRIVLRGRAIAAAPNGRRLVVAHEARRTIAVVASGRAGSRLVDVGGQPLEVAVSPDGRLAALTTAFWDEPGVALVDLPTATLRARAVVDPAPFDLAFAPDGRRLIVSGGEQEGTVNILDAKSLKVVARKPLGITPRGIARSPRGSRAWIALNGEDRVVGVDLETGRIERSIRTPHLPDRVAVAPDAGSLLVTHSGRDAEHVSEIDLATGRLRWRFAGRLPSAVAWTAGGVRLVALGGAGEIVAFAKSGRPVRHQVGGSPRGLAVAGDRAWTVDALSGSIQRVRA